jgi:hypothetical protein
MSMAYLITHLWPGGTEEQYRATLAAAHPAGGLPDGQVYHAAGPTEGGFLVVAVWESKEHFDRFLQEKLLGGPPIEGGLVGPPEQRTAETVNVQTA